MCNTVKRSHAQGFTLVEMAVVIMIIGLLIAPAIGLYDLYRTNQRIEQTDFAMQRSSDIIGGFLASYGRYPCPASATASPGDLNYGYEDCTGGAGIISVASLNTTLPSSNNQVLIGSLPFRTLNMQETETLNGYGNRLTYAVTEILTDKATYAPDLGGISIIDIADENAVTPEHGAHFAIVTHGNENDGATDYTGVTIGNCATAPLLDQENCNNDSVFRSAAITDNFDDEVNFSSGIGEDPWQYQDNTKDNIHLKVGSHNLVAGEANLTNQTFAANAGTDPIGIELRSNYDTGVYPETGILHTGNIEIPDIQEHTGAVVTDNVCDTATTANCFNPRIIGGNGNAATGIPDPATPMAGPFSGTRYGKKYLDDSSTPEVEGGNIYCDSGALIGVRNGQAVCADTITFACPPDQFVQSIGSNGEPICSAFTSTCPSITAPGFCGGTITIPAVADGSRAQVFSGECYKISGFDETRAETYTTLAELNTYLAELNNDDDSRSLVPCPNNPTNPRDTQIRETFTCNGTNFDLSSRRVRERGNYGASWSGNLAASSNANNSSPPYNASAPMSVDPNNNAGNHDCWCREDYFATTATCAAGGTRFIVYKSRCPNTGNRTAGANREVVWDSDAEENLATTLCNCVPGPFTEPGEQCYLHFGLPNNQGVVGNVVDRLIRNCPDFSTSPDSPAHDLSECTCPDRRNEVTSHDCPAGTMNSFTFEGIDYENKSYVRHRTWTCPTGVDNAVTNASQAGYWTTTSMTQTCACDDGARGEISGSCGPMQTGTPPVMETELNCSTGEYVPTGDTISAGTCRSCSWQPPATSPSGMDINISAASAYSTCDCNSSAQILRCKNSAGAYWDSCQCRPE